MSFGNDVDQRLKRAGAVIGSSASAQRKEKAHATVALLSISNRVGPSRAALLKYCELDTFAMIAIMEYW